MGSGAVESILAVRSEKSFSNFNDFCARVDLRAANKKVIESLVKAGALDSLERSGDSTPSVALRRARLLSKLDETVDRQARLRDDLSRGQGLLFSSDAALAETLAENVSVPPLSDHDVLKFEKEVLGFYFSGHPLVDVKDKLKAVSTHEIASLSSDIQGLVRVAGMINQVKRMVTKSKGEQWARATLEDLSGEIALLIFPRAYASGLSRQLAPGSISSVSGRLSFRGEGPEAEPELIVDEIQPLDMALIRFGRKLYLAGASGLEEDALQRLRQAMDRHPGNCPVFLDHETPEGTAVLELDQRVRLDENLLESIETILGEKSWRIESAS